MTGPIAQILPCGRRLHLQHGPIDLIIGAEGGRDLAFAAAQARFETVLHELVAELPSLRRPVSPMDPPPNGAIAQAMQRAALPHARAGRFVTPMAAVAGAVAEAVLDAMRAAAPLRRAYVNNGGDIALFLAPGQHFTTAMAHHDGSNLGRIEIAASTPVRGIATSGQHGRSQSLGIADSVSVLAPSAAAADVAATLIANAVDLPGHPGIRRCPARLRHPESDLGDLPIVTHCGPLAPADRQTALARGRTQADEMVQAGLITAAALFLQGESQSTQGLRAFIPQRSMAHA
jgi:ApbE superfamily uncharacterized protein (UPF0280 family)